MKLSETI
jgi:hypothetical protein